MQFVLDALLVHELEFLLVNFAVQILVDFPDHLFELVLQHRSHSKLRQYPFKIRGVEPLLFVFSKSSIATKDLKDLRKVGPLHL